MAKHKRKRGAQSEQRRARQTRRRKRFWLRAAIVLVVTALVFVVAFNWNTLSPGSLIGQIGNLFSGGAKGSFPVDVSGSTIYNLDSADSCTVMLSDTHVTMIDGGGKEVMRRTHSYTNPLLRTSGKYVLLAETGGKRIQLETRSKTCMQQTMEYTIVTAAVHANGNVAVVTAAEQGYNACLLVYNESGRLIYRRLCGNLISDVAFSPNGNDIAVATVGAEGGAMQSSIEVYSLGSQESEPLTSYARNDIMLLRIAYLNDSVIAAIGDNAVWMYKPWDNNTCLIHPFSDGELKAFAFGSSSVATVTQPYGASAGGTVSYIGVDGNAYAVCSVDGACRDIAASGDSYAVLTDAYVYAYGYQGVGQPQETTADSYRIVRIGQQAMVLGLQSLVQYSL